MDFECLEYMHTPSVTFGVDILTLEISHVIIRLFVSPREGTHHSRSTRVRVGQSWPLHVV